MNASVRRTSMPLSATPFDLPALRSMVDQRRAVSGESWRGVYLSVMLRALADVDAALTAQFDEHDDLLDQYADEKARLLAALSPEVSRVLSR